MNNSVNNSNAAAFSAMAGINGATQQAPVPPAEPHASGCGAPGQVPPKGDSTPTQNAVDGAVGGMSGAPAGVKQLPMDLTKQLSALIDKLTMLLASLHKGGSGVGGESGKVVQQVPSVPPTQQPPTQEPPTGRNDGQAAPPARNALSTAVNLNLGLGVGL